MPIPGNHPFHRRGSRAILENLISKFVGGVVYPLDCLRNERRTEWRYLREFNRTQFLPPEALRALQERRLAHILDHAYRRCPFYRDRFRSAGLKPADIRTAADLTALPILEKRDIQEHRDRMIAEGWPADDRIEDATGGSSGTPLSFVYSRDRKWARAAATVRHNRWAGWRIGDRAAMVWGAPRDFPTIPYPWSRARQAILWPSLFLDTGHVTEAKLTTYGEALRRFRPRIILAYARSLALLARTLRKTGAPTARPHAVITSSETLEDEDRAVIESVFGAPVFNRYGCREFSVIASECERHEGLHTMAEGLLVEIVTPRGPAAPGEVGSVLVTDLLNPAMPLIRYRIGDLASWMEDPCPCGRGLPRLQNIAGRVTDFLVGGDGRLVSGVFLATYVVAQRPSLGQVQIRQDEAGRILYRIRPGDAFDPDTDTAYLTEASRRYLGDDLQVTFKIVDDLPPEPSGKFIFSRSTVSPEHL